MFDTASQETNSHLNSSLLSLKEITSNADYYGLNTTSVNRSSQTPALYSDIDLDFQDTQISTTSLTEDDILSRQSFVKRLPVLRTKDNQALTINAKKAAASPDQDSLTGLSTGHQLVGAQQTNSLSSPSNINTAASRQHLHGTLRADRFIYRPGYQTTIISAKGNVDFGLGQRDVLDLSGYSSASIRLNLTNNRGGGVLYNPGNGYRLFDSITLSNGNRILFEGIDRVRLADQVIDRSVSTNDPLFRQQWNLHMMGVHNAWRFTTGGQRVAIGVQDTGLGTNGTSTLHTDLDGNRVFVSGDNYKDDYEDPQDQSSHGTSVHGIISARTNNGIGMSGINWRSNTYHIDVLGGNFSDQSLEQAAQTMINAARQNGQRLVINMSLQRSQSFNQNFHQQLAQVIANNPDVLFVIAAGNDGDLGQTGLASPAMLAQYYNNVIAVGASQGTRDRYGNATTPGQRISYSQYGPGLTVMAPTEVVSPTATKTYYGSVQFDYTKHFNGTSAATPNVAGVASLVWSINPGLRAAQVKAILAETAFDLGAQGYDQYYGHGLVNADAAVRRSMALARLSQGASVA